MYDEDRGPIQSVGFDEQSPRPRHGGFTARFEETAEHMRKMRGRTEWKDLVVKMRAANVRMMYFSQALQEMVEPVPNSLSITWATLFSFCSSAFSFAQFLQVLCLTSCLRICEKYTLARLDGT